MDEIVTITKSQESPASGETPGQFYQQHLANWNDTGLSQAEYCRRNGLIRHRFGYWKKKLFKEDGQVEFGVCPTFYIR